MADTARQHLFRRAFALLLSCLLGLAWAPRAEAAGKVTWKSTSLEENKERGSWRIDVEVYLAKAPNVAHLPVRFEFLPISYTERSLADGQTAPVERKIPLTNQQPIVQSVDLGFMDPGSGEIQARTRFTLKVTRALGFEAGEYKVTLRDSRDDSMIGTTTVIKFLGENEVIDRRSMVFEPSDRKKEKKKPTEAPAASASAEASAPVTEPSAPAATTTPAPAQSSEGQVPPSVEERPGGGCHYVPHAAENIAFLLVGLVLGVGLWARRKS